MKTDARYTTQPPDKLRDIALNLLATEGQKLALAQSENLAITRCISELEEARKLARQARFSRKSEAFTGWQKNTRRRTGPVSPASCAA